MKVSRRQCVGTILIKGWVVMLLSVPQYTHAFSFCDYIGFALKPLGFCVAEVPTQSPEPVLSATEQKSGSRPAISPGTNQPVDDSIRYQQQPRELSTTTMNSGIGAGAARVTNLEPVDTEVIYMPSDGWQRYAAGANTLFDRIVMYLVSDSRRDLVSHVSGADADDGETDDGALVSRDFLRKQVDRIYDNTSDSRSLLSSDLTESFETELLTVPVTEPLVAF